MRRRVVVLVDVDAIHDVDQFAEEEPRRQRHFATEARGHLADESAQEPIVDALRRPCSAFFAGIEIPDARPDREQPLVSERKESHLRRPQVVEAAVVREVHLHALIERRQGLQALVALEEVARAGDDQVQAGQLLLREHVHQLPKRIERLLASLRVHALDGLDLVEHDHQAPVP